MKKMKATKIAMVLAVLLTFTACGMQQEGNRTVIKEPGKSITIIENENTQVELSPISVERIDRYEGAEITDWLDEQTVLLAKENRELGKMSLAENSEFYPRSLYLFNLEKKEYKTVKTQKNMFLGGATFSPDKKHLLYYEYSIGDMAYYLMGLNDEEQSPVAKDILGTAYTAQWADAGNVIGASYAGGAYMADTARKVTQLPELQGEQLYTVQKIQDRIYYITNDGSSFQLYMLNMATGEKKKLKVENADGIAPSPDGKQLLISQMVGSAKRIILADADGNILRTVAEGTEVTGISWSPDQRRIAYRLKSVINGTTSSGLYVYDVLTGKSVQIAVDMGTGGTSWSPSGEKIAVTETDGRSYNSSIIYLK